MWRSNFEAIVYRAFRSGRTSLTHVQEAFESMYFRKTSASGLMGLVIKSLLQRNTLEADSKSSYVPFRDQGFYEEFSFLTEEEINNIVMAGCKLFYDLQKVLLTALNKSETLEEPDGQKSLAEHSKLKGQLQSGMDFLTSRMKKINKETGQFAEAVKILKPDNNASAFDGASSQ
mmetsp:Transcript_4597/g.6999  ORF Transcript_4597/g.6999 Transcript_4597/m.6999 type:complete len:174 (-) Transcript_4597:181-702(-)